MFEFSIEREWKDGIKDDLSGFTTEKLEDIEKAMAIVCCVGNCEKVSVKFFIHTFTISNTEAWEAIKIAGLKTMINDDQYDIDDLYTYWTNK